MVRIAVESSTDDCRCGGVDYLIPAVKAAADEKLDGNAKRQLVLGALEVADGKVGQRVKETRKSTLNMAIEVVVAWVKHKRGN